jgi:hypothetical protein
MARTCWRITFEFDNVVAAIRSDADSSRCSWPICGDPRCQTSMMIWF